MVGVGREHHVWIHSSRMWLRLRDDRSEALCQRHALTAFAPCFTSGAVHPWLFWDCRSALGKVLRAGKPAKPNAVRCVLCAVRCACQLSEPSDPAFWKASPSSHAIPLYLIYPRCSQSTRECLKEGNWSKENETEGDVLVAWLFSRTLVLESLIFFSSFSNLDLHLVLLFTPIC